jgi:hypothetical protein
MVSWRRLARYIASELTISPYPIRFIRWLAWPTEWNRAPGGRAVGGPGQPVPATLRNRLNERKAGVVRRLEARRVLRRVTLWSQL